MATEHDAWLKLTKEDVIERDLPICDPHLHLREHEDSFLEAKG